MPTQASVPSTAFAPAAFTSFGALLLYLRRRARLRQRDLAVAVGYSEAQIGRLENDQRLPDLATVMAQFVPALGLEGEPELVARLVELAQVAREGQAADVSNESEQPVAEQQLFCADLPGELDIAARATPFLGRVDELADLEQLLTETEYRCITLLGPGGVGKTRLALEAATRYAPHFAHGVCLVPLAGVNAPHLLLPAIAQALRLPASRTGDPLRQVSAHLRDKQMLLLLDNLEHLMAGAALLAQLLAAAPDLRLLVTSRERLRIQGEATLELAGLALPPAGDAAVEELVGAEAVELFLSNARRALPTFSATPAELAIIGRICRLVEGLPLAIELSAAWLHLLALAEIERELQRTLDFLHTNLRDLPLRHRSLRAAFTHSWELLSAEEQRALRRLSVFRGNFSREAASAVLSATEAANVSGHSLLTTLSALANKSMLRQIATLGTSHYALHELVRQYAAEHLQAQPAEARAVAAAHSRFYLELLQRHEQALRGQAQQHTIDMLALEGDNLRAAIDWSIAARDLRALRRSFPALQTFFECRYAVAEALPLFLQIGQQLSSTAPPGPAAEQQALRALALASAGWFTLFLGQAEAALELLHAAQALAEQGEDHLARGDAALFLGAATGDRGDSVGARRLLLAAMRAYEAGDEQWHIARTLYRLALLAQQEGNYVDAHSLLRECLTRLHRIGDPRALVLTLNNLGVVEQRLGRYADAQSHLHENLLRASAINDQRGVASALKHMGGLAQQRNDHQAARYFLHESQQIFHELDERPAAAEALAQAGYSALAQHNYAAARRAFATSWQLVEQAEATPFALNIVTGYAALDLHAGHVERAAEALTLALYHPSSGQDTRDRAAHLLCQAEVLLMPYAFVSAQARGRASDPMHYLLAQEGGSDA